MTGHLKNMKRIPVDTLTCFGKRPLETIIDAIHARDVMSQKNGVAFNFYYCRHCGKYHVGHKSDS